MYEVSFDGTGTSKLMAGGSSSQETINKDVSARIAKDECIFLIITLN